MVIAVDAEERTLDALALGHRLADATGAPAVLVTVFAHHPLHDPADPELVRVRAEARDSLLELAGAEGLDVADARHPRQRRRARAAARERGSRDRPHRVVGSTSRGPLGRLLPGGVGERLLSGGACPIAVAPRGYGERAASTLRCIGVGLDGSQEARLALDAAVALASTSGAKIRVITVFQRLAFGGTATTALPGESANDAMRGELRAIHHGAIADIPGEVEVESRFVDGAADELLVAERAAVDLLVVGSRGYGPVGAVLLGSVSTALACAAACPIIVTPRDRPFDLSP